MPTSRPFAYNTGSAIAGAMQTGSLAIGTASLAWQDTRPGGLQWWNGPDEDLGYVIAFPVPDGNVKTPTNVSASVRFKRSSAKTDASFINLVNNAYGQNFSSTSQCYNYLTGSQFWTSYVNVVGVTFSQTFTNGQAPGAAIENAWTTFRSQLTGTYTTMTLSNNLGTSLTVTDAKVQDIANALRTATTGTNFSTTIGSITWRVIQGCVQGTADANSIYLTSSGTCDCGGGTTYTVRPMIKNLNWGGLNSSSCGQPTQTITVTFS
jgi:hypothetical protein